MSSQAGYGDPETRGRILRVTWDLLLEAGPDLRLADVATRAGLSRQAVYLHFGNRAQLLLEVLAWGDLTLELTEMLAGVAQAASGIEGLERIVRVHAVYSSRIDAVAQALEADQYRDEAVAAALRHRLDFRRTAHREVIARIAAEGALADGWTIDTATDIFAAVTMLGPWRELTRSCGWSPDQYAEQMTLLLRRALIATERSPRSSSPQVIPAV